ncbi:putative porin [Acinetobacter towneri]|uniref:putative porin n=1 Tax=Acinetobacter towneri TaxID=202956 RepID=UPI001F6026CC|nr:putative porin [Acinetobacter towneri]UNT64418.1 putative porin [Acinetobacter towneri]
MFKKLALATALLAGLSTAHAYQFEINGGYENTDFDGEADVDTLFINGKYYLNGVQVKNAPLAEAAFLAKASNIGLGYAHASIDDLEFDLGPFVGTNTFIVNADLDIDNVGISGEFYIPNSQFYISGNLNHTEITAKVLGAEESTDNTGYALEVGYLPTNGLLLAVGATNENIDPIQVANYGFTTNFLNAATLQDDTAVSLRAKYVTQIGNHFTNFEGLTYFGDETTYRLGADLYIDPTLSVGVSIADSTADDSDTIFGVRAQKFFTPTIAVGVNYTTVDEVDSFGINGTFRF